MLDKIIYSDEQETYILRVVDAIPLIEAYVGLKVMEVLAITREDVESAANALYFEGQEKPDALWWFTVRFASPEGARDALLKIALFGRTLKVIVMDERPRLVFFSEALRKRAKEDAPALTREYIELLERIVQHGAQLWKHTNDYHPVPDLYFDLYQFYRECRKIGFLLPDAEDGGPQGLGFRKVHLPEWVAKFPGQYITGEDEPPL